jgi:hypothetical protein
VVFTPADIVSHRAMRTPNSPRFETEALLGGAGESVRWDAVRALVRATHSAQVTEVGIEKGRAFAPGRAVLTGGIVVTAPTEKEVRSQVTRKEQVLYLFHHGAPPWLFAESRHKYEGLGPRLKPGTSENFQTLVQLLRERAPQSRFDDRLLQFRGAAGSPNTPETIDLLAHLIALA